MRRRHFLRLSILIAATGSLGRIVSGASAHALAETTAMADQLLRVHHEPQGAAVIGNALIHELSHQPELDHVVQSLMRRLALSAQRMTALSPHDLRILLKEKTSEEFDLGQVTRVQGWVLGETEAWFCGLAALRAG